MEQKTGVTSDDVKARWNGHELAVDLTIAVDENLSVAKAEELSARVKHELVEHIPPLTRMTVTFGSGQQSMSQQRPRGGHQH